MAILVAVLAVVLLGCAALTVDLGNAWARKRDAQTQADVSVIAAGNWARDAGLMPADQPSEQTAVRSKVAEYMLESGNVIVGQPAVTAATLGTRLGNGDRTDGEVVFTPGGGSFEVVTPAARVDFGLASVLGQDHVDVQADAGMTVYSELPDRTDVLPFLLPSGCVFGPADADTTGGGGSGSGGGSGGGSPTSTNTNGSTSGPGVLTGATQSFQSTDEDNSHDQWTTETFTFRVVHTGNLQKNNGGQPLGDPVVHFQFQDDASVRYAIPGVWTSTPRNQQVWTFKLTIEPDDVTSRSVQWSYQTQVGTLYSNVNNLNVQTRPAPSTPPPSTACTTSSRGNFGQMDSPRKDTNGNNNRFAHNIAFGLDHQIEPLVNAAADECTGRPASTSPVRKAEQLDNVSRDGSNCILPDPGNDGPKTFDGLIGEVDGKPGRLRAVHGATRSGCNGGDTVVGGRLINNDLLSCYLVNAGDPLSRIAATSGVATGIIDPAVTRSPRFVWLPVVYRADRSSKTYQPVLRFVPGFITDESASSTRTTPAYTDTVRDNGIQVNGNSVKALTVFTFNPDALPVQESSPYTTYNPAIGRPTMKLTK
ncbi:pilus assembly protein TadG-related protein [Nocardioides sp. HDW12B]|uniref:pilus assembly protein TadG-related protein n=1 Tax=Nocardioides sp. HDW12B TaxID=2714939 RepID=UPI00197D1F84|nr:pilus assembly protein TadG-related protein [Nocardioides sp. HDW12B]